jgi:Short C-terminal domain
MLRIAARKISIRHHIHSAPNTPLSSATKQAMHLPKTLLLLASVLLLAGCATPPQSDPSQVENACAQQCSANLTTCSSGFTLFPIVKQKQCNDTYDVCIKGCPARTANILAPATTTTPTAAERLKKLEELFKSGAITREEYDSKRKEILSTL